MNSQHGFHARGKYLTHHSSQSQPYLGTTPKQNWGDVYGFWFSDLQFVLYITEASMNRMISTDSIMPLRL